MDIWVHGYMGAWIYVTMRKKYICAYIGLFYCIRKYIYNVKLKAHEKLKKKEKKRQKTSTSKKKNERRKEKGLETRNEKSKRQYINR